MIESIQVKNVASFNAEGILINDLKKINFIYGANGSGKTTLTRLIDNPDDSKFTNSTVNWVSDQKLKALVYNKDFRETNFGKGKIEGVFTLGKATKDEIEDIRILQIQLDDVKVIANKKKETLLKLSQDKQQYEDQFKEVVWINVYKKHEILFKEVFLGVMKKETFKSKILSEFSSNTFELKSYQELENRAKTILGTPPKLIQLIEQPDFTRVSAIEINNIWQKKIIGKTDVDIAKLIQLLNINDWVNEGMNYLQKEDICPFCQQKTITLEFRKKLEDYYDDSFIIDTKLVKSNVDEYNQLASNLINALTNIETSEKSNSDSKLNVEKYSAYLKTLTIQFISNKELLYNKIKEPSRSITLIPVSDQLNSINVLLNDANIAIASHNLIVSNFITEKSNLINEIWRFLTDEYKVNILTFNRKTNGYQKGIEALNNQYSQLLTDQNNLSKQIGNAAINITSVQPSVNEINQTLNSYGFCNFHIIPSKAEKNFYQIQREDGTYAESTLSEGEITFITFLYFLQLVRGSTKQESVGEERILVIDDPISSLDSNVLFVVSSLLKEIIKSMKGDGSNIKQIILLTHNVYFHKEVSFIDGRTTESNETNYWILRKNNMISEIQSFGMKNPIHSAYELLWQELRDSSNSGISVQNSMRRIIENYFKLLGKYGDDDLIKKFSSASDREICRSLICWINEGSHGIPDDLYIEQPGATIDIYRHVFKSIFEQMGHIEHYNMMMRVDTLKN